MRFARENRVPEFVPRDLLAAKDAVTLARELLALTQEEFSAVFKGSPMKRAKLRGLKRNAAVVLENGKGNDAQTPGVRAARGGRDPVHMLIGNVAEDPSGR